MDTRDHLIAEPSKANACAIDYIPRALLRLQFGSRSQAVDHKVLASKL